MRADRLLDLRLTLAVGLGLRVLWASLVFVLPFSDPAAYWAQAQNILAHGVYGFEPDKPNATWPPGTSFLYAAVFSLPGPEETWVKIVNVLISTLNIWLAYAVATRLFGQRAGLVTGWLMALWPQMIFFTTITASEPPFIALTLAGVLFWDRVRETRRLADMVLAGVFLGLACYVRSVGLLLPVAMTFGALVAGGMPRLTALLRMGVVMLTMAVVIAPWTIRNYVAFDTFVLMSSNFGSNLYMGNADGSTGRFGSTARPRDLVGVDFETASDRMGSLAVAEIRANPDEFLRRSVSKFRIIHDRETIGVAWNQRSLIPQIGERGMQALKWVASLYWGLILAGGVVAILWHFAKGIGWRILFSIPMAAWGYFASVHVVILAADRFHMPQAPFIAMLTASMLAAVVRRRGEAPGLAVGSP